ncbi:DNA recombination protein RmuC [Aquipseudomonas alcaligenes]|uniref:DNA recombination protein RmuC n=1 Tax=Aquipseudomonas alcaligenes TaxID=43263 RepID=A0AA42N4J2_AQUAC|nr:DNA recombination protein RmuC [Pseudomonas alcaligenes]MDH1055986.1 DNA recombination protein RmuC [Pseudomonas alcaligenes]
MQASQWTPEIIVICAVLALAAAVIGFVLATLRQSRQINQLGAQLEQVAEAKTSTEAQSQILQSQLRESEGRSQALQVEEGKLKVQLQASVETNTRLMQELQDHKAVASDLQVKLDQANRQHHEAAKRLEAAQTSVQGQQEQMRELRERLDTTSTAKTALQEERDRLKDALANEETRAKVAETSEHDARAQLAETKQQLHEQVKAFGELQERFNTLSSEHTKLKTTLSQREEHFQEQMTQLADARKSLTQEFENLANKIFEEKGKTFTQTSQTSIDGMLKPFREQIEGFQKRINEVHDASLQGNTSLNSEIKKVLEIGLQMSKEANNLTSALKGDSQQRGAWGEAQLRRTLEMSGLIEEAHYEVQAAFKDAEGRSKQTDYLIKLPDGKHIIIDSKVSLVAYDRAVGSESPEEYQLAMAEHVKAVRKHIDDLASKDYTNLAGIHSPDFVLMFMPIEPAYIEAMKHNKDLFEYGYKKHIVLVSHTTLIPILRTVANLWMIERSNAEAREISEKAGEIYNQVCLVAERIGKLGGTLNTASNHYNSAITALAGQQGLYGKIDRFSQLSAKVSKTLPTLEPVHVDFQSERLSLIVEALDESPEPNESLPQLPADDHEGEQSSHTETSPKNEFEFF